MKYKRILFQLTNMLHINRGILLLKWKHFHISWRGKFYQFTTLPTSAYHSNDLNTGHPKHGLVRNPDF